MHISVSFVMSFRDTLYRQLGERNHNEQSNFLDIYPHYANLIQENYQFSQANASLEKKVFKLMENENKMLKHGEG